MFKTASAGLVLALAALLLVGCATPVPEPEIKTEILRASRFETGQRVYVERFAKDNRGIEQSITRVFDRLGFDTNVGPAGDAPADVDYIVSYEDGWMWDLQMYMLDLRLTIADSEGRALARGSSRRVSFIRSDAEQMTYEIFEELYRANAAVASR